MIDLNKVQPEERNLLWNMNQKYLYEMTNYYPDDMDENGNYHYGNFDSYFTDSERDAFFICCAHKIIGFAMVNTCSYLEHETDHVIAEFTIFPAYRRMHYAGTAAEELLSRYSGKWQIKYNEKNTGAKHLWEAVTHQYNPVKHRLNDTETVLEFQIDE